MCLIFDLFYVTGFIRKLKLQCVYQITICFVVRLFSIKVDATRSESIIAFQYVM